MVQVGAPRLRVELDAPIRWKVLAPEQPVVFTQCRTVRVRVLTPESVRMSKLTSITSFFPFS